jgi:hypothetical protein
MKKLALYITALIIGIAQLHGQDLRFYGNVVNNGTTSEVQIYGYKLSAGTENLAGSTVAIYYNDNESVYQSFNTAPLTTLGWTPDVTSGSSITLINNPAVSIIHTGNREFQAIDQSFAGSSIGQTPTLLYSIVFDNTPGTAAASEFEVVGTSTAHPAMKYIRNDFTDHDVIIVNGSFPVELLEFEAEAMEGNRSLLTWTTASELNNKGFQIERNNGSPNGGNWEALGFVDGFGTTDKMKEYSFIDTNPRSGENLYRLKQVDFNGDFDYSEVRTVWFDQGVGVKVYPNPTSSFVNVKFEDINPDEDTATYSLIDMRGRSISEGELDAHQVSQINLNRLPEGTYMLKLFYQGRASVKEIIKVE